MLRILGTKGRIEVKDFWFAGGNGRRHRQDRRDRPRRQQRDHRGATKTGLALFLRGRCRRRGDPRRPAGIRLARHGLGRQPRQSARARQMARRGRARIRHREGGKARQHDFRPAAAIRRHDHPQARDPGPVEAGVGGCARLRGFPHASPRARSCSTPSSRPAAICSTRALSMAPAAPRRCSASGCTTAACASNRSSSARARTRRSAIPM